MSMRAADILNKDADDNAIINNSIINLELLIHHDRNALASDIAKRMIDIIVATAAIILLLPLLLIVAVLIKIDSPGPVFFFQERYGLDKRIFRIAKFRTMHTASQDVTGANRTVRHDPRVTKLGRLLRKCSIDELPQLFNVLTGDMSLIGPRPHPVKMMVCGQLYEDAVPFYHHRHLVRPGLSGLAQIYGYRGEVDTREKAFMRLYYDLTYIKNYSLALDLKIALLTVHRILFDRNNCY